MNKFPYLETENFTTYIADNSPLGIHKWGYNGLSALIPRKTGNNIFVPSYSGLNYEGVSLSGLKTAYRYEPKKDEHQSIFEPRCEPMFIESADKKQIVLVQPETAHTHISARITFRVEEPNYLHQRIELTFHKRFCKPEEKSSFQSLWASYMHMPPDVHLYTKPDLQIGEDLEGWVGFTKDDHRSHDLQFRPLPKNKEIGAEDHLKEMKSAKPLLYNDLNPILQKPKGKPSSVLIDGSLPFYYGFCHESLLFLQMFKNPEQYKLAYSPCGGGQQPAWSPAWDYILHLDDVETNKVYTWDLCLAVKEFESRKDILKEVKQYSC